MTFSITSALLNYSWNVYNISPAFLKPWSHRCPFHKKSCENGQEVRIYFMTAVQKWEMCGCEELSFVPLYRLKTKNLKVFLSRRRCFHEALLPKPLLPAPNEISSRFTCSSVYIHSRATMFSNSRGSAVKVSVFYANRENVSWDTPGLSFESVQRNKW